MEHKGNYISVRHLLDNYPVDAIRYFLSINDPEKKDFNFTWEGFINSINGELLGKWGNFVNRTLQFINKSFEGRLTNLTVDNEIEEKLINLYDEVGSNIEDGYTKDGLDKIFNFIAYSNKYFDEKAPWTLAKEDKNKCEEVLYNCCNIIINVNNLLKPYLIKTTESVEEFMNTKYSSWEYKRLDKVELKNEITALFERYDKSVIEKEIKLLGK